CQLRHGCEVLSLVRGQFWVNGQAILLSVSSDERFELACCVRVTLGGRNVASAGCGWRDRADYPGEDRLYLGRRGPFHSAHRRAGGGERCQPRTAARVERPQSPNETAYLAL